MHTFARRVGVVAAAVGMLLVVEGRVVLAQTPNDPANGTWVLNRAKSTFSGNVPEKRVVKIEVVGDAIKVTTETVQNNGATDRVEYTAKFDGKDYPISNSVLDTVSVKRVNARTVERTGKVRGEPVETQTRTVSSDGKVLTVTTKGTNDGVEYSSTQVFERQ